MSARKLIVMSSSVTPLRRAPRRFKKRDLVSVSDSETKATDYVLARQMGDEILRLLSSNTPAACGEHKLLPTCILSDMSFALFICNVVAAAKAANRVTGVPAAILIADAWCEVREHQGAIGASILQLLTIKKKFRTLGASFLHRASLLQRNGQFKSVIRAADRGLPYTDQMRRCEMWKSDHRREELIALITGYALHELDEPPRGLSSSN